MDKIFKDFQEMLDGKTDYLSAERSSKEDIQKDLEKFKDNIFSLPIVSSIFQSMKIPITVLNKHRQIVFINKVYEETINAKVEEVAGLRLGEVFYCQNALRAESGCGTSCKCEGCKFAEAIKDVYETGKHITFDFEIINQKNEVLSYKIDASKFENLDEQYLICSFVETGKLQEKKFLESVFLHDVKNRVAVLQGVSEIIKNDYVDDREDDELKRLVNMIFKVSNQMRAEIDSYENFINLKDGELELNIQEFDISSLLESIAEEVAYIDEDKKVPLKIEVQEKLGKISTDKVLLSRALLNVIKNAVEASGEKDEILISACQDGEQLIFFVKNSVVIPEDIQRSLFNRVTTTKGTGRGYGCFSIKLIVEKFLGGEVSFISNIEDKTIVTLRIPCIKPE